MEMLGVTSFQEPEIFNSKAPSGKYYDEATGNYSVRETFGSFAQAVHQVRLFEHLFGRDKKHTRLTHGNLAVGVKVNVRDVKLAGIGDDFCKRRKRVQNIGLRLTGGFHK